MLTKTQRGAAGLVASAAAQTRRLWHNAALALALWRADLWECHPPADAALVGGWEGEEQ